MTDHTAPQGLVFHGGPWDGTSQAPKEGFPAPNEVRHRDWPNGGYFRFLTDDHGRHHYQWRAK